MTYDKETRKELMEEERIEDFGDFDDWIGKNKEELIAQFIDTHNLEWKDFCKDKWKEHNERLN